MTPAHLRHRRRSPQKRAINQVILSTFAPANEPAKHAHFIGHLLLQEPQFKPTPKQLFPINLLL